MITSRQWILVLLPLALAAGSALADPAHSLTIGEGFNNPLGFYDAKPAFSWKLPPNVKKQSAYDIQVTIDGKVSDTRWVQSDQSTLIPWTAAPLASRTRAAWRINFRDQDGAEGGWSDSATFELGILSSADWKAKWIHAPSALPATQSSSAKKPDKESVASLRRSFAVAKKVSRARVYVTARGLFELKLNGQRVGNDYFVPGLTSYNKRLDTLTYDVTNQIHAGDNQLDAQLGTGWYAGRYPFSPTKRGPFGHDPALLLQLELTYDDGSTDTIASDDQWQASLDGPIVTSSIYDGEEFDARRQPTQWTPVVADSDLGPEVLAPKPFAPVRETTTVAVQKISQPAAGKIIFDLGQNIVGWARVHIPVEKDKTITINFAEMLKDDGTLYNANYRSAKSTDTFTAAETGVIDWQPHFTFHGFRYVQLSGLPEGATPEKNWVTGVVLHSDLPVAGVFNSSSQLLNQLQSNTIWSWRGNSLDIPTDCPQRDERAGWTGDAEVFCSTSMFNTDAHAFWKSWLGSLRDDQDADGVIPDYIPDVNQTPRAKSPGWMDAATVIPWNVYVRTGDISMLSENYEMMQKLVGWYRSQAVNNLLPNIKGYGDWLQPYATAHVTPDDRMGDRRGDTPMPLLGAAYYARSAQILADSAAALGHTEDAKRFAAEAADVRKAFTAEYFGADGKLKISPETQTAYALAISFDLIPSDMKPKAGENLARMVNDAGMHLRTGFLGTPVLADALDQTGHADIAAQLLFQESYPSWFFPIKQGATTMWERWNSFTLDKGFGDVSMNSFNHYSYGAIGQWMYERIAGLAPDPAIPSYKHFFVRPLIVKQLDSASAQLETPYGKASSAWTRNGSKVSMEIIVPPNTSATVYLPDGRPPETISAGDHQYTCDAAPH